MHDLWDTIWDSDVVHDLCMTFKSMTMDRNSHIIQQQLENLREKGKYVPVWISDAQSKG